MENIAVKNLDGHQTVRLNGLLAGRDHARRYPDIRLRDIKFGLTSGLDDYAVGFREGFYEAGGRL